MIFRSEKLYRLLMKCRSDNVNKVAGYPLLFFLLRNFIFNANAKTVHLSPNKLIVVQFLGGWRKVKKASPDKK